MKTTTTIISTWKEEWQEFYNEALKKTLNSSRVSLLNYTNGNIDVILAELVELQPIFPHLAEATQMLHNFLDYKDDFQSVNFQRTINEHIQIRLEPNDCTTATIEIECLIEFENDYLSFVIDEHDPEEIKINLK